MDSMTSIFERPIPPFTFREIVRITSDKEGIRKTVVDEIDDNSNASTSNSHSGSEGRSDSSSSADNDRILSSLLPPIAIKRSFLLYIDSSLAESLPPSPPQNTSSPFRIYSVPQTLYKAYL